MGLGDRDAARAKTTLEDGESKRERIGALESVGEEAPIGNMGSRAGSEG